MKNLITLFASLTLSSLMMSISVSPAFSQSVNREEVLTRTITLEREGQIREQFPVTGTRSEIEDVLTIITALDYFGVDLASIRLASQFILAGADPTETGNLMLSLNGMAMEGQDVDVNKLSSAINAYNAIIDKADAEAIASLKNTESFIDIGEFLKELRAAIG